MVLNELFSRLGLKVDGPSFQRGAGAIQGIRNGLSQLGAVAKQVSGSLKEPYDNLANAAGKLRGAASPIVSFLKDAAVGAIDYASEIHNASEKTGIGTTQLQELAYAAKMGDVEFGEMTQAMGFMSRSMMAVSHGTEGAGKAFSALHVNVKDARGGLRPVNDVLGDVAEKFKAMPNGAAKTALAMEIFGRSGARMIPVLNEGRDGLARLGAEAHKYGAVQSPEMIAALNKGEDNLKRLGFAWQALKIRIGASVVPILQLLLNHLTMVKVALGVIATARIGMVLVRLVQLGVAFGKFAKVAVTAVRLIGAAFAANPWLLVVAGLVAAAALIYRYWDQIGSALKRAWNAVIGGLSDAWHFLIDPIKDALAWIERQYNKVKSLNPFHKASDAEVQKHVGGLSDDQVRDALKVDLPGWRDTAFGRAARTEAEKRGIIVNSNLTVNYTGPGNPQDVGNVARKAVRDEHQRTLREAMEGAK